MAHAQPRSDLTPHNDCTSCVVLPVLLSEVLHQYHPKLVELHNYSPALSLATKRTNWQTLNHKVIRRLHLPPLTDSTIQQLAAGQKGAIERLLWQVKQRLEDATQDDSTRGSGEEKEWFAGGGGSGVVAGVEDELVMTSDGRVQQVSSGGGVIGRVDSGSVAERSKDARIADQRDTIDVLHDRIAKLEQLLQSAHTTQTPLTFSHSQQRLLEPYESAILSRVSNAVLCVAWLLQSEEWQDRCADEETGRGASAVTVCGELLFAK